MGGTSNTTRAMPDPSPPRGPSRPALARRLSWSVLAALTPLAVTCAPARLRPALPGPLAQGCNNAGGQVMRLTPGEAKDEDGAFALADDGTIFFAFISNRSGNTDVWMTSSEDAFTWTPPWPAVQTPSDDLMNHLTRTRDGTWHLTGRRGKWGRGAVSTWDSTSTDLVRWSTPHRWTPDGFIGAMQQGPGGDYWMVTTSRRSGNADLYMRRSHDGGQTWWDQAAPLTADPREDFLFDFRITRDGTFVLLWERHEGSGLGGVLGRSSDVYVSTSPNGLDWKPETLLTPETRGGSIDAIPALLEGPRGEVYAAWLTTRFGDERGTTVMVPVVPRADPRDVRVLPVSGYSVRGLALRDGRYLLAWVESGSGPDKLYYYRILCGFTFDDFPPPAATP